MIEVFAFVFIILSGVVAVATWRRILLPESDPRKVYPPLSTWLMFTIAISLSLLASFHTEKATWLGNIGIAVDVLRGTITVGVLIYVRAFGMKSFDFFCIAISLAICGYWWRSGAAEESVWMLQGVMAAGYIPVYLRLWQRKTESLFWTGAALIAGIIAFGIARARDEGPPQVYALRAVGMVTAMIILILRIMEIEHRRILVGKTKGYRACRLFALDQGHELYRPARDYVLHWIRHPDPGSCFDRATWWFRGWLPPRVLFWMLGLTGRDCILLFDGQGRVASHVFFQRRWFTWSWSPARVFDRSRIHMFNVETREDLRGCGLGQRILVNHFLLYCYELPGIYRVRLSAGGTLGSAESAYKPAMVAAVYKKITLDQVRPCKGCLVRAEPNYWLHFLLKEERAKGGAR